MSEVADQLKQSLGLIQFMAVKEAMKRITIEINTDEQIVIVRRHNKEPLEIGFEDIEDFVNSVN